MPSIDVLVAFHHPLRRRIFDHLSLHGPAQVGTLAKAFGEQVGSISHHLRMLERSEVVERAPELATDGRTSWWRARMEALSWSVDDFEAPADKARARAAVRVNIDHHLRKLSAWHREQGAHSPAWRRAAFSTDSQAHATPAELAELSDRMGAVMRDWRAEVEARRAEGPGDESEQRETVFVFAHGFPSKP